jgi:GYF domain 2
MATKWFYKLGGRTEGPISATDLLAKVREGVIKEGSWVRKNDSAWFPAEEVSGLFEQAFRDQPGRLRKDVSTEYHGD